MFIEQIGIFKTVVFIFQSGMGPTVVHATIQVKIKLKSMNQISKTFLLRVVIADKCSKDKEVN